jgi:hypothetical protein
MSRTTSRTAGKLDRALQQVEANIADAHVQKAVTKVIESSLQIHQQSGRRRLQHRRTQRRSAYLPQIENGDDTGHDEHR